MPLAWREGQATGDEEDARHQCFFHKREESADSEAGSDSSEARLSIRKVPAADESGMRFAITGIRKPMIGNA